MRTILLVTDLEGVAGVDSVEDLFASSPDYPKARALLTAEVRVAAAGFREAGYQHVRVSELEWRSVEDLFAGVEAIACLGMHAPAGTRGFAAHTVNFHGAWSAGERALSESDLVLGLAAARGVPVVFVSGDDVLGAHLGPGVPYVSTKTATSITTARSRPPEEVHALLRAAAARPAVAAPALPDGPWQLRFKSRWAPPVILDEASARARCRHGLAVLQETEVRFAAALRTHDPAAFREDAVAALARGFDRAPPPPTGEAARRALAALLRLTDGDQAWQRSERALALHMLETFAPRFFAGAGLGPVLAAAAARLAEIPGELPLGLDEREATLRVDAVYLRASRGLAHARLDGVLAYVESLRAASPLYAWLIGQMAAQVGLCPAIDFPRRPLRTGSRVEDLYWLTHLFVLATRFLRTPLAPAGWETETEELFLAVPWALSTGRLDLAAELAMCLQLVGEDDSAENRAVVWSLLRSQRADGTIVDHWLGPESDDRTTHTTLVALCALARYA